LRVGWILAGTGGRTAVVWLATRPARRRAGFADRMIEVAIHQITRSGPTFIKMAQLLSTRVDLLPPALCARLATLHDNVPPMRPRVARALADKRLGGRLDELVAEFDAEAVASGSIACVYRATLRDGSVVAVKVRRARVDRVLRADLTLMRVVSGLMAKLPAFRSLPVAEMVGQLSAAIAAQLDFRQEAHSLLALEKNLRDLRGVRVPALRTDVVAEQDADGILVMEFVPGLVRRTPADLPVDAGPALVSLGLDAVYQMLFRDGLVHNDLHPGNLYFMADGSIVIVDAGFVTTLSAGAKRSFAEFFYAMAMGNGVRCADILTETGIRPENFDLEAFRAEIAALVTASSGARSKDFNLLQFSTTLFDIQRRHQLYAEPEFVFPILSLLVFEGAIKEFAPETDFQSKAVPYVLAALVEPGADAEAA
jgi:ubiquinone biosynthesis protein